MFLYIKKLFIKAAWAPIAVLAAHNTISKLLGHRPSMDPPMHFLGGAAMAYFFYQAISTGYVWFGESKPLARSFSAFCAAVTVAVFWEFMEFAGDKITGDTVQISLDETMYDLILGSSGALAYLLIHGIIKKIRKK